MGVQSSVRDSIQEVDFQTWVVGEKFLLSASPDSSWGYSISEVYGALPASRPLSTTSLDLIRLVYDAGDSSAVWAIGDAFLKVKKSKQPNTTREHVTLACVKAMNPSFTLPDVIFHGEWDDRQYMVLSKVPGRTLSDAWPEMDDSAKEACVQRVVSVCNELARHHHDHFGGVDGNHLLEPCFIKRGATEDFSHENLLKSCKELGMDCSTFVFSHLDLGPGNLILDKDRLGIIDWEMAGFVPRSWIRTKFCVSGGLDLPGTGDKRVEWRRLMQRRLGTEGYPEIADDWMKWWLGG